jgi:hypothetical protein
MSEESRPLSDEERAELEELRAEKRRREQEERDRRDREELERLRAERDEARGGDRAAPQASGTVRRAAAQDGPAAQRRQPRPVSREEAAAMARDAERRERGRRLMEPDDDLRMPLGQKVVLAGIALVALVFVLLTVFGPK